MTMMRRALSVLCALLSPVASPALAASKKKSSATPTPAPLEITEDVVEDVPDTIRQLYDTRTKRI